jgi:hypothetical protein
MLGSAKKVIAERGSRGAFGLRTAERGAVPALDFVEQKNERSFL